MMILIEISRGREHTGDKSKKKREREKTEESAPSRFSRTPLNTKPFCHILYFWGVVFYPKIADFWPFLALFGLFSKESADELRFCQISLFF